MKKEEKVELFFICKALYIVKYRYITSNVENNKIRRSYQNAENLQK